ncbi:TetR/AcrR family transcriptional regulator [Nocardia sp. A7]|uniref:TetR/AcrR family transcriptional regulator n=1 Tax=Nocardia sp. A7 TaxID=2789274 RepID=UPI00397D8823
MGNREDLLAGARKVILERGVAKATARDIATAAGVSLAAIGYHFGSKDRLVTEALSEALGNSMGQAMDDLIAAGTGKSPLEGLALLWNGMPEVFAGNHEAMLASLENIVRIVRSDDARAQLGDQMSGAFADLGAHVQAAHPELDAAQAAAIGRMYFVIAQGLGLLWLLDPGEVAVDGDQLTVAVQALAGK